MDPAVHSYRSSVSWAGSTAEGYEAYDRTHTAAAAPAEERLTLSGDPGFGGDPRQLNPEQLLVMAASSCQLLSFLAVAARARLDVVAYSDDALAVMPEDDRPMRLVQITLRPTITVRRSAGTTGTDASDDRLRHLCEVAHRECFIANSLRTEVVVKPSFTRSPPAVRAV